MSLDIKTTSIFQTMTSIGNWLSFLGLRLLIAWEFWDAGIEKYNGSNSFENIVDDFPFPLNVMPVAISWFLATWTELIGAIAIAVGFMTRFWVFSFIILDIVAWYSVHAGNGYNVSNNGYKLPLMYLIIMIPLLLNGAGKLSLDYLFLLKYKK